jgi:hypothetical protein
MTLIPHQYINLLWMDMKGRNAYEMPLLRLRRKQSYRLAPRYRAKRYKTAAGMFGLRKTVFHL